MRHFTRLHLLILLVVLVFTADLILLFQQKNTQTLKLSSELEHILAWEIYWAKYLEAKFLVKQLPVKPNQSYTIALVGDSMTDLLRSQENKLKENLKSLYKGKEFVIYNYGFGSTNVLSLKERVNNDTVYQGQNYKKLVAEDYNLIIIESFGNNPLSEYPLEVGLKKQTEELDKVIPQLKKAHPHSLIVFLATIAPTKTYYGQGIVDLDTDTRKKWATEREAYIQNHIKYAQDHRIPLINVFAKTRDEQGEGLLKYLSPTDYIHPSAQGVEFINSEIAQAIINMRLLPL